MKSIKSLLLIALFIGSIFAGLPAFASTGTATLWVADNQDLTMATLVPATTNVSVVSGSPTVLLVDAATPTVDPAYLIINLSTVVWSGAQFSLYISPSGYSQINTSTDVLFSPIFDVLDLSLAPHQVGSWWLGNIGGMTYISGPLPTSIPGGKYFIKIYDGSSTSVAVSQQYVSILPKLSVVPSVGPAGRLVTVTGTGYTAGGVVNASVWWPDGSTLKLTANVTADAMGTFTWSVRMPDVQNGAAEDVPMNVTPTLLITGLDYSTNNLASAEFTEQYRQFEAIVAWDTSGDAWIPDDFNEVSAPYANDTAVEGWVLQKLHITGNLFNPTSQPYFKWDGAAISPTEFTAINGTGYFKANFTIPITTLGTHHLWVFDATNNMTVEVDVQTTLILDPNEGPYGTTVTAKGYGFNDNANFTLFWFGTELTYPVVAEDDSILLASGNTGPSGSFTVTFLVPYGVYGGEHDVLANDTGLTSAKAVFTVTPKWSLDSTTAALGTMFHVIGQGLPSGLSYYVTEDMNFSIVYEDETGSDITNYGLTYDNTLAEVGNFFGLSNLMGNATGYGSFEMVAAGVPMVHYVGVIKLLPDGYKHDALLSINVTGNTNEGKVIISTLSDMTTKVNNIVATVTSLQSTITALSNSVTTGFAGVNSALTTGFADVKSTITSGHATLTTALTAIQTSVNDVKTSVNDVKTALTAHQTQLTNAVTTITTAISSLGTQVTNAQSALAAQISGVGTSVTGVQSAVTSAQSALSTKIDAVNTGVSNLQSSVSSLSGSMSTLSGTVNTIKTTTESIKTTTDGMGTITTVLYIAVLLAAIAVVLEIILLIRKK